MLSLLVTQSHVPEFISVLTEIALVVVVVESLSRVQLFGSGVALMIKGINISHHNAWHNLSALSI